MKKLIISIALLIFSLSLFAEKISFPVDGFFANPPEPVTFETEWDESWFGSKPSSQYNHDLARVAGIFAEVAYVEVAKHPDNNELLSCYEAIGVSKQTIELHYDMNYENAIWGNNQAAFSIAYKKINSARGKRNLIILVIRGTPLNANEWISNLNVSDHTQEEEEFHEGFLRTTKHIESALIAYMLKNKIDIDDCFLLITGHSRGAATANLLAAQLYDTELFNTDNIYCYTFATPNVTISDSAKDPKYNYIWNIVNAEDIVPAVPMNSNKWKYKKYGQTKVLINNWNTDPVKYSLDYQTRMNYYFRRLMNRNYCPFNLGPFFPIQLSYFLTTLNKDIPSYYKGIKAVRFKAEDRLWKIFPAKTKEERDQNSDREFLDATINSKNSNPGLLVSMAANYVTREFGVDAKYLINCFVDMHAMETYLSWILALPEEDVFSDMETSIIQIYGSCDYAVFDDQNTCIATIRDGKVIFEDIHEPIAASSFLTDFVSIGIPANRQFKVIISKESLLPTKAKISVQHYSAEGILLDETNSTKLYPYNFTLYEFGAGNNLLEDSLPAFKKVKNNNAEKLRTEADLHNISTFRVWGELSGSTSGTFNAGVHVGSQNVYGSFLLGHNFVKPCRSIELSPGIGHQSILTGKVLLNSELFGNLFWAYGEKLDKGDKKLNFVPTARFLVSFKPKHKTQLFAGVNLEFLIKDFNDAAFDEKFRFNSASINSGLKVKVVPNFQLGFRF